MTRFIPLPRELLDHSTSDAELQDRWVEGATKQLQKLYAQRRTVQYELDLLNESIAEAEKFLQNAKQAQTEHRQREQKDGPQYAKPMPPQVQALLSRRTPEQVQALLKGIAEQATEIADERPAGYLTIDEIKRDVRRSALEAQRQIQRDANVIDVEWHPDQPKLPKPQKPK